MTLCKTPTYLSPAKLSPASTFFPDTSLWALRYQIYNFNLLIVLCFISRSTGRLRLQSYLPVSCTTKNLSSCSGRAGECGCYDETVSVDCIFPKIESEHNNNSTSICCFDPFCFSRQFHTTLINHRSDNLWLNDYCCCRISGGNEKKDYNEKSARGWLRSIESVVLSWFLMRILCRTTNVIFQLSIMLVFAVVALLSDLYDKSFRWVFLGVNELI